MILYAVGISIVYLLTVLSHRFNAESLYKSFTLAIYEGPTDKTASWVSYKSHHNKNRPYSRMHTWAYNLVKFRLLIRKIMYLKTVHACMHASYVFRRQDFKVGLHDETVTPPSPIWSGSNLKAPAACITYVYAPRLLTLFFEITALCTYSFSWVTLVTRPVSMTCFLQLTYGWIRELSSKQTQCYCWKG